MNDLNSEYQHYGVATKYDNSYAAGHSWESPDGEVACGTTASPYMINWRGVQTQSSIGTKFITEAGLNKYADTNSFLVLYRTKSRVPRRIIQTAAGTGGVSKARIMHCEPGRK